MFSKYKEFNSLIYIAVECYLSDLNYGDDFFVSFFFFISFSKYCSQLLYAINLLDIVTSFEMSNVSMPR